MMIAIPTRGNITIGLLPALFQWKEKGATIVMETAILIDNARNRLTKSFLDSDKEYLLFIDSDMQPNVDSIDRLLKHNKDIISGLHHVIHGYEDGLPIVIPSSSTTMDIKEDGKITRTIAKEGTGLQKVEGLATSFLLIHRKVFKDWNRPWFKIKWNEDYTDFLGEDYWFCVEARKRGFDVWTDTDVIIPHVKEVVL